VSVRPNKVKRPSHDLVLKAVSLAALPEDSPRTRCIAHTAGYYDISKSSKHCRALTSPDMPASSLSNYPTIPSIISILSVLSMLSMLPYV